MLKIKNYYNSKLSLENKKDRVLVLKHEIEDIKLKLEKITSSIKENATSGGSIIQSKIHTFTIKKISLEEELEALIADIDYLEPIITRMGERVNQMTGLHKKVFISRYKDEKSVQEIALKENYSVQRIYQILDEVNEMLGIEDKD